MIIHTNNNKKNVTSNKYVIIYISKIKQYFINKKNVINFVHLIILKLSKNKLNDNDKKNNETKHTDTDNLVQSLLGLINMTPYKFNIYTDCCRCYRRITKKWTYKNINRY